MCAIDEGLWHSEQKGTCNLLQHNATHFNTLQYTTARRWRWSEQKGTCHTLEFTGTHCSAVQPTATHCDSWRCNEEKSRCNTVQPTTALCNTLQHSAPHWHRWRWSEEKGRYNSLNQLQHTATHCNTLQHKVIDEGAARRNTNTHPYTIQRDRWQNAGRAGRPHDCRPWPELEQNPLYVQNQHELSQCGTGGVDSEGWNDGGLAKNRNEATSGIRSILASKGRA